MLRLSQDALDMDALHVFQRLSALGFIALELEREIGSPDVRAPADHQRALYGVLQLAYVARPVVAHEHVESLGGDGGHGPAGRQTELVQERVDEQWNVFAAVAEGRQLDTEHVQPVIEIGPEIACLDERLQ